ncbi:MAG: leucine-rich repeat protein [Prevotella sp.]|nr:leucine-rich repeat protein [Prevotella sp.]
MKKILFIIAILLPSIAFADQFTANIKVDGKDVPAEFVTTNDNECVLGSGYNACISQYVKGTVIIPNEVTYNNKTYKVVRVNTFAFRFCTGIVSAYIPEGITSVGNFAFVGCSSLYEVELPSTLKTLGSGSFINLPKLRTVKCNANEPPTWEYNDVFYFHKDGIGTTESVKYELKALYVPTEAITTYQSHQQTDASKGWDTAEGWSNFAVILDGKETTFHIRSVEDFEKFRDHTNNHVVYKNVELDADIDFNNKEWTVNIGDETGYAFVGTFNGNGHTISRLTVKNKYAGLFARVQEGQVRNLMIKDCTFEGTESAGAVCGRLIGSGDGAVIDSIFSENNVIKSAKECGGIVGHVSSFTPQIKNCVVKGGSIEASHDTQWLGGIVGYITNTSSKTIVQDCALLETSSTKLSSKMGPFIAGAEKDNCASVSNCFTTWDLGTSRENKVPHTSCVFQGAQYDYKDNKGITQRINFTPSKKETMLALGVLKLDNWVYCPGEYPLPACFEDRLPDPKVNVITLRPKEMPYGRANGLSLKDENLSGIDFTDLSGEGENSFVKCDFTTALLWVDDQFGSGLDDNSLPINKLKITASEGLDYDRVLEAEKMDEKVTYSIPIYETDADDYVVFDDDGQPVIDGYEEVEMDEYTPVVYPLMLPFQITMPINCQVFKPAKVTSDADGVATIELQLVENQVMEANTPYYVVVNSGSVELATPYEITIEPKVNTIVLNNDYEFSGTSYYLNKGDAVKNSIYRIDDADDLKWHLMTADNQQDISAFRAYFRSKNGSKSDIKLSFETITDKDFEYAMYYDTDNSRYLYATKYIGEGGDVVVPNTVTAKVGGEEQTMSVAYIDENAFKDKADKIRSVDLTKCENLEDMYVDRKMKGNSFYGLKENTLVFIPEEKAFPSVNVVVGDKCQKLLLKEGETFYSPYDFKAVNVEYKRDMKANDYYTICLPYSAPAKDGLKYYELSGVTDATLQFSEVTETKPGVPYLVVTSSSVDNFDFDGDDNKTTDVVNTAVDGSAANGITMLGTFTKISPAETVGKYILQDGNKWQKAKTANPAVYIDSFHAYLTGSANARELFDSEISGEATAIKQIHTTDKDGTEQWFDLNGHRIDNMSKKGVYIQKGKKVVLH